MIHRFIFAALFPANIMAAPAGQNFVWEGVNPLVRHIRCAAPDAVVWNNLGNYTDANGIEGSKHRRNVCFDKMHFDDDGSIQPVEYTLEPEGEKR
jgi:hypothetical protein